MVDSGQLIAFSAAQRHFDRLFFSELLYSSVSQVTQLENAQLDSRHTRRDYDKGPRDLSTSEAFEIPRAVWLPLSQHGSCKNRSSLALCDTS